ncbi:hypothetical protein D0Y65_000750 [Glycine soja]|uniref:Uncharacterized protein n=1 Tax=Glycine soja TaxID=3848 RepID=A0A445LZZ7_GLYSO|nr:hypothetical protein D0Y65_000750 [Glycine soja]
MIQRLAVAWEKKSPTTNIHTAESSGGDEGTTTHEDNRWRNLEIPIFGADDPMSWLTKIERYFRLRTVREEDKLEVVMVTMNGEALGNPFQVLLPLEQEETMQGFIGQFEKCVGMVKGLEEPFLVEVFLKGLKEEISTKVRLHEPKNLMEAMVKARRVEDKNKVLGKLPLSNSQGSGARSPRTFIGDHGSTALMWQFGGNGLSQDIQSLVCPHDSKELVRAMEVAHNIEDSMKQVQSFGNLQGWSTSVGFRYQGGNGAVSRLGAFGGTNNA